jgi:SAF domain
VQNVAAGQLLTAADLQVVRVSASGPVSLVPAADEASVVGRPAAGPLPAGTLLTSGDLGLAAPAPGQDDLGVAVKAGQYPPDLSAGQTVTVLATPAASSAGSGQGTSSPALPVGQAVVLGVDVNASSGATVVELRLSQNAVPQVAAAAATGQIALATIPAGG